MRLSFRQGIVRYQTPTFLSVGGSFVSLVVTDTQCIVAFADGTKDYLYVEQESVSNAWGPLFTGLDQWLYWDIERRTGIRTFGITTVEPVAQPSEPASPAIDQHWFDTSVNQMKVWNGVRWLDRIRVFACKLSGGVVPISMSINAPDFDGTQAGLVTDAFAGPILFDANTNQPLKTPDHKFITTEDKFATRTISFSDIKLAALILSAEAQQNMTAFTVVRFTDFNEITFADAFTSQQLGQFGIIEQNILTGEFTNVVLEGVITNPAWAWTTVNAPLYSDSTGTLTDVAPIPNAAPVAIVVGASTIIFGSPKNIFNNFDVQVELATSVIHGLVRLNIPPTSALDPVVIGANDPRLVLLDGLTGDVQDQLDGKVDLAGDTMTGFLTLNANPTANLHAATKQYVDANAGTPAGANTQIQFNNAGAFGADPDLTYNAATGQFFVNTTDGSTGSVAVAIPGAVGIFSADSSSVGGQGGQLSIIAGNGTGIDAAGGDMDIRAGSGQIGDGSGGSLSVGSGSGTGTGNGGSLELSSGAGGTTGVDGVIKLLPGGNGFHEIRSDGTVFINTVDGATPAGFISQTPGVVGIFALSAGTLGDTGGSVNVIAGSASAGTGGNVTVQSGGALGAGEAAGNVNIFGGEGGVGGTHGSIIMQTGSPSLERFRISGDGDWWVNNDAGLAGQVLTSNGAGTSPTWQAGGGGGEPANQIVFGTGAGTDSDSDFTYSNTNGKFYVNTLTGLVGSVSTAIAGVSVGLFGANATDPGAFGGAIFLQAGTGAEGGNIVINAGNANVVSNGGNVSITGGQGSGLGGQASLSGGFGTAGTGGPAVVTGGQAGDGDGGLVRLLATNAAGVNNFGGAIEIFAGAATGNATGGFVTIQAGGGGLGVGDTGTGGDVGISGGIGGALSGDGGGVSILGGAPQIEGNGGSIQISATSAVGDTLTARFGGTVQISAGDSIGITPGGGIQLTGGNSIASSLPGTGTGGDIVLNAGNAAVGVGANIGGTVQLRGGTGSLTGEGGFVSLTGGNGGTNSAAGGVIITGGEPVEGNGGSIQISGSAGVGTDTNGGNVELSGGAATGIGVPGVIEFGSTYVEASSAPTISAGTLDIDFANGNHFIVSLNANITSLTLSNVPTITDRVVVMTILFLADGTLRTIAWPASFRWVGGLAPTMSSTLDTGDVITATTYDGGVRWLATATQNFPDAS